MQAIDQLAATRKLLVGLGDSMEGDLMRTPTGFANNPLWNLGHLAVTLRLLVYKLSGLEVGLPDEIVRDFGKGSGPATWEREYAWRDVSEHLVTQPAQLRRDYDAGLFGNFQRYETSAGVVLESVDEAIAFNAFHEGIHLGYVLAQRKVLSQG